MEYVIGADFWLWPSAAGATVAGAAVPHVIQHCYVVCNSCEGVRYLVWSQIRSGCAFSVELGNYKFVELEQLLVAIDHHEY